jgi:site-specific recombinase XerD
MAVAPTVDAGAHFPTTVGQESVADGLEALVTFELLRRWAAWMEVCGRYSPKTQHQYRRSVISFLADELIPLEKLTEDDVVGYLARLPANGNMRGQMLRALRCFYAWASDRGMSDPVRRLKVPRRKYGAAPFLEPDDLERVFEAAGKLDPRARPTLELMYATGARLGSIVAVLPSDVDLTRRLIHFRVTKGDRPYSVPLGERAFAAVTALLSLQEWKPKMALARRPTLIGVGHGTVERWVSEAGAMVGVRAYPHLLRHSFAERICNDPAVPDLVAAELLNHADTSLLRRYARGRAELQRQAVASL